MNLIISTVFLIICIIVFVAIRYSNGVQDEKEKEYWEKEYKSNSTRKQSLDGLDYITIPEDILLMKPENTSDDIKGCLADLSDLSEYKIVNLTGISNTDLKLTYGTANITILMEYDFHYTNLASLLQKLAEYLYEADEEELACRTLEFAISTKTDVSKTYYLLAEIYDKRGEKDKILKLSEQAQELNSIMKDNIIKELNRYLENC